MLLLLSTLALAVETDCQELKDMSGVGIPGASIVEAVEGTFITEETRICIAESSLPTEVRAWALAAENPPPVVAPEIEIAPDNPPEETPEEKAARELREAKAARDWARQKTEQQNHCEMLPNPGTAAILSLILGYGAGHFYSEQPERGWRFVAGHALVNGVMFGGLAIMYGGAADLDADQIAAGNLVILSAATAGLILHAADAAMAPESARQTGEECY